MGFLRLIRKAAPFVALGAAGVVAARRRGGSQASFDLPAPPAPGPAPGPVVVEEPPPGEPAVNEAPPVEAPPVEAPPVEVPPFEEPPVEGPPVAEPAAADVTTVGSVVEEAPDDVATGARSEEVADEKPAGEPTVVRSVYDAPPVAEPREDPLDEEPPVERPGPEAAPTSINEVVDDLLAPPPADERIEDATLVDDEAADPDDRPR